MNDTETTDQGKNALKELVFATDHSLIYEKEDKLQRHVNVLHAT